MRVASVLHVITGLGQGGAESMLHKLVAAARRADPSVAHAVVSLGDIGVVGARMLDEGIPVISLGMRGAASVPRALRALSRRIRQLPDASVVQTWMYHADLVGGLAARLAGQRNIVWSVRQTGSDAKHLGRATLAVIRGCAALSHHVPQRIVCNTGAALPVHARWGYAAERFVVLPNGFDTQAFAPDPAARQSLRRAWGVSDDEVVVGMVGRLHPIKGHSTFIEAASLLAARMPNARFLMVGEGVMNDPSLAQLVARHGLGERCRALPPTAEVSKVMNAIDILCLSSLAEGFPNVIGEAMSCGTPVASTDVGEAGALIDDPLRLAPPGDPAALAVCLERLVAAGPAQRRAIGQRDRQRIIENYGIDAVWARYRTLYDEVVMGSMPSVSRPGRGT